MNTDEHELASFLFATAMTLLENAAAVALKAQTAVRDGGAYGRATRQLAETAGALKLIAALLETLPRLPLGLRVTRGAGRRRRRARTRPKGSS